MKYDKLILGENAVFSTDCSETGLNNNILVCGGSGSGKTMSISEPRLLETYNSSVICTVTKRRLVNKYKPLFEQRGYVVGDLNFCSPAESNIAYDPLKYVKQHADITFLAQAIVKANPKKESSNADPYWDDAATSLLSAEIAYVMMTNPKATFADVLAFHDTINIRERGEHLETSVDKQFEVLATQAPKCFAMSCWKSFHHLPYKTAGCVFSTLNTLIDTTFTPQLRKMISLENKVDFEQLATRKTALFISTSGVNPSLHSFVNMFYAQAFKSLIEYAEAQDSGKLPISVNFICDDFATGSPILNFPEFISIMREARMSVCLLLQSESQLESIYGDDATTIINNCDTYVYMGGIDIQTGRVISERLNAPLEDVLYMPIGKEFVFRRGQKPIVTERYNIRKNELYRTITEQYENEAAVSKR